MRLDLLQAHAADGAVTEFFSLATAPLGHLLADACRHGARGQIVKVTDPYRSRVVWSETDVHVRPDGV